MLIDDCLAGSPEFAALWAEHEVAVQHTLCKHLTHPVVGELDLLCEILLIPDRDQRVLLYTAEPGSRSHQALQLLKVVGTQDMSTARG